MDTAIVMTMVLIMMIVLINDGVSAEDNEDVGKSE